MANQEFAFINFLEYQDSVLNAGKYSIAIRQKLTQGGNDQIDKSIERFLHIRGNRFSIEPADVFNLYPAAGSESSCEMTLPYLMLNRSSLPWQRSIDNSDEPVRPNPPWLVLLIFHEVEGSEEVIPIQKNMTLAELHQSAHLNSPVFVPGIDASTPLGDGVGSGFLEFGEKRDDTVTVIDVDADLLAKIMPKRADLPYTGHVRREALTQSQETVDRGSEKAVIIANRLPLAGSRNVAHLVSIHRTFTGEDGEFNFGNGSQPIRLVSLKSWSFQCKAQIDGQTEGTFKDLLVALDCNTFKRTAPEAASDLVKSYFEAGFTALPHHLRIGESTVSLYRGPLSPGIPPRPPQRPTAGSPGALLPVESADKLLLYDRQSGMLDVSYSAAWTLGRQMALADRRFSLQLYAHKQLRQIEQHAQQQALADHQALQKLPLAEEKAEETAKALMAKQEREQNLKDWLNQHSKLNTLPFPYLVPSSPDNPATTDEAFTNFLPAESIRFFQLDNTWFECLQDGALSVGETAEADNLARVVPYQSPGLVTGLLLRSRVVANFPALEIEGFETDLSTDNDTNLVAGGLVPDSSRKLSNEVLLCLFEGREIKTVDLFLPPSSLHFGLQESGGLFIKQLKDVSGLEVPDATADAEKWHDQAARVMNLSDLADSLQSTLNTNRDRLSPEGRQEFLGDGEEMAPNQFTSADFAMQMLEGAPRVRISIT